RIAVLEGLQQKPEYVPGLLLGNPQGAEHPLLHLPPVDPPASAADFIPVENQVISLGPHFSGIRLQKGNVLFHRHGEGMVHGVIAPVLFIILQQGEFGDPGKAETAGVDQAQFPAEAEAQLPEHFLHQGLLEVLGELRLRALPPPGAARRPRTAAGLPVRKTSAPGSSPIPHRKETWPPAPSALRRGGRSRPTPWPPGSSLPLPSGRSPCGSSRQRPSH